LHFSLHFLDKKECKFMVSFYDNDYYVFAGGDVLLSRDNSDLALHSLYLYFHILFGKVLEMKHAHVNL
jgi:hypothetical protein